MNEIKQHDFVSGRPKENDSKPVIDRGAENWVQLEINFDHHEPIVTIVNKSENRNG